MTCPHQHNGVCRFGFGSGVPCMVQGCPNNVPLPVAETQQKSCDCAAKAAPEKKLPKWWEHWFHRVDGCAPTVEWPVVRYPFTAKRVGLTRWMGPPFFIGLFRRQWQGYIAPFPGCGCHYVTKTFWNYLAAAYRQCWPKAAKP